MALGPREEAKNRNAGILTVVISIPSIYIIQNTFRTLEIRYSLGTDFQKFHMLYVSQHYFISTCRHFNLHVLAYTLHMYVNYRIPGDPSTPA